MSSPDWCKFVGAVPTQLVGKPINIVAIKNLSGKITQISIFIYNAGTVITKGSLSTVNLLDRTSTITNVQRVRTLLQSDEACAQEAKICTSSIPYTAIGATIACPAAVIALIGCLSTPITTLAGAGACSAEGGLTAACVLEIFCTKYHLDCDNRTPTPTPTLTPTPTPTPTSAPTCAGCGDPDYLCGGILLGNTDTCKVIQCNCMENGVDFPNSFFPYITYCCCIIVNNDIVFSENSFSAQACCVSPPGYTLTRDYNRCYPNGPYHVT